MRSNNNLTITFLGTGTSSGVPMIGCACPVCSSTNKKDTRLRSSILIQSATTTIVIDTTPDFRYQMLRAKVNKLDAVVYTHPHKDHLAGLDDVRAFNYLQSKPMQIFANALTQEGIMREFAYAFAEKTYPGIPQLNLNTISEQEAFTIGDITLTPILVWHLKMPVLGYRIGNFAYITDANFIDDKELQKLTGIEVLVINALRKEKHISHYTLPEAIALAQQLQVRHCYFTHISHQLGLHAAVSQTLPQNYYLGYDGLQLNI
jgi:phosphoribosyl 1,2-cyclic phosphate phosphodiesterase